jgi:histidine triad (HIT) family protein
VTDCIFCKIAAGDIPCKKAYEDEDVLAFHDIHPQAPVHILVIPKAHILAGAGEITAENSALAGKCFEVIAKLAEELHLTSGFRVVTNNGPAAGQTVPHLHFHLLGGKELSLTMG